MMPIIEYLLSKKNNKVDSSQEICLVILEQDGFNFTIKYVIYDTIEEAKEKVKECCEFIITIKDNIERIIELYKKTMKGDYSQWNKEIHDLASKVYSAEKFFKLKKIKK